MWGALLEFSAEVLGATKRARGWPTTTVFTITAVLLLVELIRWGAPGVVPIAAIAAVVFAAAGHTFAARAALWRAALSPLGDPQQVPGWRDPMLAPPTARALARLATAADAARRGRLELARDALLDVDRTRLDESELFVYEATRTLVTEEVGRDQAELDRRFARLLVQASWNDDAQLGAFERLWARAGVDCDDDANAGCLRQLVRIRIGRGDATRLPAARALRIADEARAVGDETLAMSLEAAAQSGLTYR